MSDLQNLDRLKIIKRLEVIKGLISLEEEDEINAHIFKLEKQSFKSEIENIIVLLKEKSYGDAIILIEAFIKSHHHIGFFIEPEIEALRFEAKTLEAQIQQYSNEKAELEKLIHEFGVRHNQELGELIIKILQYRKEQSKGTPQLEEAEKDFEDFYASYKVTKDKKMTTLTEFEQNELKSTYRKASKLCHPDVVSDEQKRAAHIIFMELNVAYESNDLKRIKQIFEDLQKGRNFTSKADNANEKITLQVEMNRLRKRINELIEEISNIQTSETFEKIANIKDWDEYFEQTKQQLQDQLNQLKDGIK